MMQFAKRGDMPEVIAIWQEGFGDAEEEIRDFFDAFSGKARVCLWKEEGRIMGQLVLLPVSLHFPAKGKAKTHPAEYLYAVATKKSFQNRGVCTKLLRAVTLLLQEEGKAAVLVPADSTLAAFYGNRGFMGCFAKEELRVSAVTREKMESEDAKLVEIDVPEYEKLRKNAFAKTTYVELPKTMLSYAAGLLRKEGGFCAKLVCAKGEYGVLYHPVLLHGKQEIYIQEITAESTADAVEAARHLLAVTGFGKAMLRRSYAGSGILLPEGMPGNGYFNLVLE